MLAPHLFLQVTDRRVPVVRKLSHLEPRLARGVAEALPALRPALRPEHRRP
jgi:hypothetical protein